MPIFRENEAREYYDLTKNEQMAHRLDNALYNANFYLYGIRTAHTRERYEEAAQGYFQQLAILREYGIFAV